MVRADLDPVRLLAEMREQHRSLVAIADGAAASGMRAAPVPIHAFLAGLRVAWRTGEVHPTAQNRPFPGWPARHAVETRITPSVGLSRDFYRHSRADRLARQRLGCATTPAALTKGAQGVNALIVPTDPSGSG